MIRWLLGNLGGVWWLEDNTANETLVTVQDMYNVEAFGGKKLGCC